MDVDVAIVGAGPYGLSSAVHLKNKGLGVAVFGEAMSFWRDHMPAGMYLRSNWDASHIAHPQKKLTLDHFKAETGAEFSKPVPLQWFVEYGQWYQRTAVPELMTCHVETIDKDGSGFRVTLTDGELFKAKRVIVATGIAPFPWMPEQFRDFPRSHVSHSSDHPDLSSFKGRKVLVIGGGQSALDSARILKEMDVEVELVARQRKIHWVGEHIWLHRLGLITWFLYSNYDVGPAGISRIVGFPNFFRQLPRSWQDRLSSRSTRPAGTGWQRPYLAAVPMTLDCQVTSCQIVENKVSAKLSDGTHRQVDHVIVATGYRVDISRYSFLAPAIRESLKIAQGHPVLGKGLESSIPGLHFLGKPAAWSFGPLLNFISGTLFASAELLSIF